MRRALLVLAVAGLGCGPWGPQGIVAGGPLLGSAEALDAGDNRFDVWLLRIDPVEPA